MAKYLAPCQVIFPDALMESPLSPPGEGRGEGDTKRPINSPSSYPSILLPPGEGPCVSPRRHTDTEKLIGWNASFMRKNIAATNFLFQSQLKQVTHPRHMFEYELSQMEQWNRRTVLRRSDEHHLAHAAAACPCQHEVPSRLQTSALPQ